LFESKVADSLLAEPVSFRVCARVRVRVRFGARGKGEWAKGGKGDRPPTPCHAEQRSFANLICHPDRGWRIICHPERARRARVEGSPAGRLSISRWGSRSTRPKASLRAGSSTHLGSEPRFAQDDSFLVLRRTRTRTRTRARTRFGWRSRARDHGPFEPSRFANGPRYDTTRVRS
jgi:hypothetical protein